MFFAERSVGEIQQVNVRATTLRAVISSCLKGKPHELGIVEWATSWPLVLPYFDGKVPAGFPNPAEDYLESELDLSEDLVENKAATFMMRVDGDRMKDAGILDGDLLVVDRSAKPVNGSVVVVAVVASTRSTRCAVDRIACGWSQRARAISLSASRLVRNCMCLASCVTPSTPCGKPWEVFGLIDCNNFYVSCETCLPA